MIEFREIQGFEYCFLSIILGMRFFHHLTEIEPLVDKHRIDLVRQYESLLLNCLQVFLKLSELSPISKKLLITMGIFPLLLGNNERS